MKIKHIHTGQQMGCSFRYWKDEILKKYLEENFEIITHPDLVDVFKINTNNGQKIFIETLDRKNAIDIYISKDNRYVMYKAELSHYDSYYRPINSNILIREAIKKFVDLFNNDSPIVLTKETPEKEEKEISTLKTLGYLEKKNAFEFEPTVKALEYIKNNSLPNPLILDSMQQKETNFLTTLNNKKEVFIVHGHDEIAQLKVARFIEKLGFKPIILHEQASSGKTIIEKIEEYTNVGFGIVLYTPCDLGAKSEKNISLRPRARQNVIFEHGYLIGKIGRENVCALVKGDIETPTDISGVVYISMDEHNAWQIMLGKELKRSGYIVDLNKLH